MSTPNLDKAANITPPYGGVLGQPGVPGHLYAIALGAVAVSRVLPHEFDKGWITIRARGTAGNTGAFNFTVGAGSVTATSLSGNGPPLTPAAPGCRTITVGEECSFYLPNIHKEPYEFYNINGISAAGIELEFWASSNQIQVP